MARICEAAAEDRKKAKEDAELEAFTADLSVNDLSNGDESDHSESTVEEELTLCAFQEKERAKKRVKTRPCL